MRWQFAAAAILLVAGVAAGFVPWFGVFWYVGVPLLIAAAVMFEWGWLRAKQDT